MVVSVISMKGIAFASADENIVPVSTFLSIENTVEPLLTKFNFDVELSSATIEILEFPAPVKAISGSPQRFLLGVISMFLSELAIRFQTSL